LQGKKGESELLIDGTRTREIGTVNAGEKRAHTAQPHKV
jgi:hypothetical protein